MTETPLRPHHAFRPGGRLTDRGRTDVTALVGGVSRGWTHRGALEKVREGDRRRAAAGGEQVFAGQVSV